MTASPVDRLHFRWEWRPYQARVLAAVERHLDDDRLHIVAAPGAGKTTLGLEVFRRLAKPALVLAPTLTIRNQWLRRLEDFLPLAGAEATSAYVASWTSKDLRAPRFFTVATYQAVLSESRREDETAAPTSEDVVTLVELLRGAGVGTLILDEAHHLKRAWWKALENVTSELDGVSLLSLTGTPPYDATGHEWRRYEELCGPIDDEISVPELVKAGTLCPHQDFVYAVAPREEETAEIRAHDEAVSEVLGDLLDDPGFQGEVDGHPWIASGDPDLDAVLDAPELAVALLAYLRATSGGMSPALMAAMDLGAEDVPRLDRGWWETLLSGYFHGSTFEADEEHRRELGRRLRDRGLLWRRTLRIVRSAPSERRLALSAAKIDGCFAIHRMERSVRGDSLRQVILTDFIRDEALQAAPGVSPQDVGAFPIFSALVSESASSGSDHEGGIEDVALVSGRLAIVHSSRAERLRAVAGWPDDLRLAPLSGRDGWLFVEGLSSGRLVAAYTRLLEAGDLRVLVGTRSLLGEGWDAPVVNSIVLASFVGAFVSTNQMRGRAIRTDPARPDKVASVWHLVAVAHGTPTGFLDHEQLAERFRTFVGLAADADVIESGIERLALPALEQASDMAAFNRENRRRLDDLGALAAGWRRAIDESGPGQVIPTVSFRSPPTLRPLQVTRTLRYLLLETGWASALALGEVIRNLAWNGSRALGTGLIVATAIPMLVLAPRLFRAAKLAFLHAPVDGSVAQIGRALLEALREAGLLEGDALEVVTGRQTDGGVHVSLAGGTFYDQSLFADAIGEILGPVANPRYLITRPVNGLFGERVDYHAVPSVLGIKRERAEALQAAWLRRVGPGELIYTRRAGGRAALLAARGRAFSNQFEDPAERLDRWQ